MADTMIAVDNNLKQQAERILSDFGITISTFANDCLSLVIKEKKIPFEQYENKAMKSILGCLKGQFTVPDDFNEPMEDFEDYM